MIKTTTLSTSKETQSSEVTEMVFYPGQVLNINSEQPMSVQVHSVGTETLVLRVSKTVSESNLFSLPLEEAKRIFSVG